MDNTTEELPIRHIKRDTSCEALVNGIPLSEYNRDPPPHAFHTFLIGIIVLLVFVAAVALLVNTSIEMNKKDIQISGSAGSFKIPGDVGTLDDYIPTEDWVNNCSNSNWTFIACTRNKTGTQCYADGTPIPITGYVKTSEENLTITYWMRRNLNGTVLDELKVFKNVP
jgi:hypothetical protein